MKTKTKRPFQTTAIIHSDGEVELCGGPLREVRAAASMYVGARAVVLREVVPPKRKARR